jgi:hypothetical protein
MPGRSADRTERAIVLVDFMIEFLLGVTLICQSWISGLSEEFFGPPSPIVSAIIRN